MVKDKKYLICNLTQEDWIEAQNIIEEGWHQISNRYKSLAKLPEGMDGYEALVWGMEQYDKRYNKRKKHLNDEEVDWIFRLSEKDAAGQFLACYTSYPFASHLKKTVSTSVFRAYKKLGGGTAHNTK